MMKTCVQCNKVVRLHLCKMLININADSIKVEEQLYKKMKQNICTQFDFSCGYCRRSRQIPQIVASDISSVSVSVVTPVLCAFKLKWQRHEIYSSKI